MGEAHGIRMPHTSASLERENRIENEFVRLHQGSWEKGKYQNPKRETP
jgi:hypothetical protein